MKKFIAFLLVAICFAIGLNAQKSIIPDISLAQEIIANRENHQMTDHEIWQIIQMSREANLTNGITNPDSIFPGQIFTFLLKDGVDTSVVVVYGDTQWEVIKKLAPAIKKHGKVVPWVESEPDPIPTIATEKDDFLSFLAIISWWGWLIIAILLFYLFFFIKYGQKENKRKAEWNLDPVSSGKPFVKDGVTDDMSHKRMAEIIREQYPGATFQIENIYRGKMNGPAIVWYEGEKQPKERIFKDVFGYEGTSIINGEERSIYFLQGCGNPAREGNFFTPGEDFTFVRDVLITEDGSESPLLPEVTPEPEIKSSEDMNPKVLTSPQSELRQVAADFQKLADEVFKRKDAHRVNLKYVSPGGGMTEMTIDAKIGSKKPTEKNK